MTVLIHQHELSYMKAQFIEKLFIEAPKSYKKVFAVQEQTEIIESQLEASDM